MFLHIVLSFIIAVNLNSAIPAMLEERFPSRTGKILSAVFLIPICIFPIVPTVVLSYILSFIVFIAYMMIFYKGSLIRKTAISMLFFSIIAACSVFIMNWIRAIEIYESPFFMKIIVAVLLIALSVTYFSIFRQYVKQFADRTIFAYLSDHMWGYAAFIAFCPALIILYLVLYPPASLSMIVAVVFFTIAAATAMLPLLYHAAKSAKLAEENSELRGKSSYYQEVENQQIQFRKFKHNLMNQFTVVATYLDLGKNDEAIAYFKELGAEFAALTRTFTHNTLVNAVLNSKYQTAHLAGIEMDIEAKIESIPSEEMEFCTLISASLDNAIEADPPDRRIRVSLIEEEGRILFSCINSYEREIIRDAEGGFVTHKEDKHAHGLGIKSIREAVEHMGGKISITAEDSVFTIEAEVPID